MTDAKELELIEARDEADLKCREAHRKWDEAYHKWTEDSRKWDEAYRELRKYQESKAQTGGKAAE